MGGDFERIKTCSVEEERDNSCTCVLFYLSPQTSGLHVNERYQVVVCGSM